MHNTYQPKQAGKEKPLAGNWAAKRNYPYFIQGVCIMHGELKVKTPLFDGFSS